MTKLRNGILWIGCALAISIDARAQQAAGAGAPAADTLEEVVVTANKREENLQNVGASVTAISGAALQERRVFSLQDLAQVIPGLSFAPSETSTPIFTLRGVGFNESSLGVYPAVSVYLDQAPLPFPVMASHTAYDLQRVEVLKGPQGTLFGENSTGGAINYIAARPTDTFEAGGSLTYGRFNDVDGDAYVSGPVTDTIKARLSITGQRQDAWQYSETRPDDRNGSIGYFAGRLITDWDPSSTIHLSVNVNGWQDKSEPQASQFVGLVPQTPDTVRPEELTLPFSANGPRDANWSTGLYAPRGDRKFIQAAVRADFTLPADLTLTSLSSYDDYSQQLVLDRDGMPQSINDIPQDNGTIHTFNQEIRLANSAAPLRWVVGANYESSTTKEDQVARFADDSNSDASTLFIKESALRNDQDIRNYAVFGNLAYNVTSRLNVEAGARYTHSRIRDYNCGYDPAADGGLIDDLFNGLGGILGKVPFTPITQGGCYTLNYDFVPGQAFVSTLTQDNVSWRVGADYHVAPDSMIYANVSRGFKAGSFPTLGASTFVQLQPVTQESVTAYEIGSKVGFWEQKGQWNAAVFYYDYKDKQIRGKITDPVFDRLDALVNVPKSRIAGAETDLTLMPFRGLTLNGNVTYLDSRVQRFSGVNVFGDIQNFAGVTLPFTPKWNYSLNADYRMFQGSFGAPFVGVSVNGRSQSVAALDGEAITVPTSASTRVLPGLNNPFVLNAYATVDLRVGYEASDQRWKVMLWGKNVFDRYYWTNVYNSNDSIFRYTGMPATYGVTFSVKTR